MNENRDAMRQGSPQTEQGATRESNAAGIGMGKKLGLYGMGLLLLGVIFVFILTYLTGYYVPFEGTEGVGP